MCSVGEDDFGDVGGVHAMVADKKDDILDEEICKKCNQEKTVVKLSHKVAQCKSCFILYVRHKFRAAIGSTKIVKRDSNVLIVFDGSPENVVLLELMAFSVSEATYKRLHLTPHLLFIDDLSLFDLTLDQRRDFLKKAHELATKYSGFKAFYLSIADENLLNFTETPEFSSEEPRFAVEFKTKIKTLTSRQEYLQQLKQNKAKLVGQQLKCQYIFYSDISQNLAKTFLANVALGRGSSVAQDLSFCDDRDANVQVIRPMRDLNINEVKNYISLNNLSTLTGLEYGLESGAHASLQNLTSKFVDDLQKDYSSTVSTVYRTGDKIAAKQAGAEVTDKCAFCHSTLDYHDSATLFAIEYSRLVSANSSKSQPSDVGQLEQSARDAVDGVSDLMRRLCHGCRNIFEDMDETCELQQEI